MMSRRRMREEEEEEEEEHYKQMDDGGMVSCVQDLRETTRGELLSKVIDKAGAKGMLGQCCHQPPI
jgi:hypothetical protein